MGPITQLEAALIALVCSSKVSKKQASSLSAQIVPAVLGESSYLPVYFLYFSSYNTGITNLIFCRSSLLLKICVKSASGD